LTRCAARLLFLLTPLLLAGCGRFFGGSLDAGPQPRYVVGPAYRAGAAWFYPREDFHLDATGLAVTLPDQAGPDQAGPDQAGPDQAGPDQAGPDQAGLTADGEARDAAAMAGAHPTLQLPAVARVTNLETGLQALIRINDRGPASPGRLIGLTRRAADRLGMTPGVATRVRVQVESGPSQALRDALHGGPSVTVASAPRVRVASEELPPPPGLGRSTRGRTARAAVAAAPDTPAAVAQASFSDAVVRVPAHAGQLWLRAGEFGQARYANQVRAHLARLRATPGTTVERVRQGRADTFRVRAGPFATVAQADAALDQALGAGVTDAHIVVE